MNMCKIIKTKRFAKTTILEGITSFTTVIMLSFSFSTTRNCTLSPVGGKSVIFLVLPASFFLDCRCNLNHLLLTRAGLVAPWQIDHDHHHPLCYNRLRRQPQHHLKQL